MTKYYIAFGVLTLVVLGAVVYGFTIIGSPSQQQAIKFDSTRITDMDSLSYSIDTYYETQGQLPTKLADVTGSDYYKDPQTSTPYTYQTVSETSYQLCATFGADSSDAKNQGYLYGPSKSHKKGYDCLTYNVSGNGSFAKPKAAVANMIIVPTANTEFKQGASNLIQWNGTAIGSTDVQLINDNGGLVGYISVGKSQSTTIKSVTWTAQYVSSSINASNDVPVTPGTYNIKIAPFNGDTPSATVSIKIVK